MSILHDFQRISFEVYLFIKIHFMKCLHRNFASAMVSCPVFLIMKMQIVFNRSTRIPCLLVLARGDRRRDVPEGTQDGNTGKKTEEESRKQSSTDLSRKKPRSNGD